MVSEQHTLSWVKTRSIFEYPVEDIPAKQIVKLLWPAINDDQQLQQELLDKEDKLDEVSGSLSLDSNHQWPNYIPNGMNISMEYGLVSHTSKLQAASQRSIWPY
ncbi:hypothetical protein M422DRAFT_259334 [Sphaerobolus stellatus SS14]|uniref:Uncharacterized protein n=1 Tax=Sphaerobolus stellatus (strain SS14) TaxID=990650 RepID=A0A0C9USY4_SPHS4|nr:hypothetical protein M422DRAFT_259334 [Sphaerobolus stellatus SS14]